MLVKIINISSFNGQYMNTLKLNFEVNAVTSDNKQKEGSIELSGYIVDRYSNFAGLKNGDIIDINIEIEKK